MRPLARLLRLLLLAAAAIALLLGPATPTAASEAPPAEGGGGFVRHQSGPYWVWFGPPSWVGSGSAYGITILGGGGATIDQGFSSIFCANGATWPQSVSNYFTNKRRALRNQGFQFLSVSAIVHPAGTAATYRRQNIEFRVTRQNVTRRGQFTFDYDFNAFSGGTNYCYARNVGVYANRARWNDLRGTLNRVRASMAYSGPGACDPSPSTPC